jgi:tetratricopeptide (TPR) repeat protein
LRIQWEQRFPLDGLALAFGDAAPDAADLPDAVALFHERTRRVQPGFAPTAPDAAAITTICQAVGGLPLGIEIAAALIDQMDCATIAHTMQQQRLMTRTTLHDVSPMQHSLYSTMMSSWQRLTPTEQRSYRRLAPFRGNFSTVAAHTVAAATTEHLRRFVDASLLREVHTGVYQFHDVLHEFAAAQFNADPIEARAIHSGHSAYFLDLLAQQQEYLHGPSARHGLDTIQADYSDIHAAWQWALAHQEWEPLLHSVQALGDFYAFRTWIQVGFEHLQQTMHVLEQAMHAHAAPTTVLWCLAARIAYRIGWLHVFGGDLPAAQQIMERGMQLAEAVDATWETALTRYFLGHVLVWRGDIAAALPHLAAAQEGFEQHADSWYLSMVAATYGEMALIQHDYAQAQQSYMAALTHAESLDAVLIQGTHLLLLGRSFVMDGKFAQAHAAYTRGLALAREMDDMMVVASCMVGLGGVAMLQGQGDEAWHLFRESIILARSIASLQPMLHATIGVAYLLGITGDVALAIELLRLVMAHPACDADPYARAQMFCEEFLAALPPEQQDALRTIPLAQTLDEVLTRVLDTPSLDTAPFG